MTDRGKHDLTDSEVESSARIMISEYDGSAMEKAEEKVTNYLREKDSSAVEAWARIYRAIAKNFDH